jgi:hypothetical protein
LLKFLIKEKKLCNNIAATSVTVTKDIKQVIFLMSVILNKFATVLQIFDLIRDKDLTVKKAVFILENKEICQKQEKDLANLSNLDNSKPKNLVLKLSNY